MRRQIVAVSRTTRAMIHEPPRGCRLVGERVIVRIPEQRDIASILRHFSENQTHLAEYSPIPTEFLSEPFWRLHVEAQRREFAGDHSCKTFLFEPDDVTVIGAANLSVIVRGAFQSAYLGYALAGRKQGLGLMHDALTLLIRFAFGELHLHRIMANYMPRNARSAAVLRRLGFLVEGVAPRYLLINGVWEDHILTSLANPGWKLG
jgi:[ribosomal protein S5]-alanine N-acetyltransferase